MQGVKFKKGSE